MFSHGVIFGVLVTIDVLLVGFTVAAKVILGSWANFWSACEIPIAAINNRESMVQVWHDDELIDVFIFEEK